MGILKTDDAWTGKDKNQHLGLLAVGTLFASAALGPVGGAVAGVVVSFAKEYGYDHYLKKGTASLQDLVVSLAGTAIGAGVYQLLTI